MAESTSKYTLNYNRKSKHYSALRLFETLRIFCGKCPTKTKRLKLCGYNNIRLLPFKSRLWNNLELLQRKIRRMGQLRRETKRVRINVVHPV